MYRKNFDRFDILLVALVLIIAFAVSNLPFGAKQFGDFDIHADAKALAGAIQGSVSWDTVGLNRLPFTTLYYGIPYLLVPYGSPDPMYWEVAVSWTLAWIAVSMLLIRRVAKRIGGETGGKITPSLVLLSPFVVYYALGITSDAPAWLTTSVFLFGWSRWTERPSARWFLLASAGLAGLVLCRPNTILILGCGIACGLLLWRQNRTEATFALGSGSLALLITVLVGIAESRLPHAAGARPARENLAHVAFHGSFQFRDEPWDWRFWDDETRQGSLDYAHWVEARKDLEHLALATGQSLSDLQLRWIVQDYAQHPFLRLRIALVRILALHVSVTNSVRPQEFRVGPLRGPLGWVLFHAAANMPTLIAIGAALWFLFLRRRELLPLWVLWAPWLSLIAFHAVTYGEPRYLMPARPALMVMAGCALASLAQIAGARRREQKPLDKAQERVTMAVAAR